MPAPAAPPPPQIRDRASLARAPSLTPALPTPSPSQDEIASGLTALRAAASKVDSAGVFSRGETKDDIATRDLRYLLTHHYVAELASRARAADPALRLRNVVEAKEAHAAFLALCERHEALTATAAATLERERERDAADSRPLLRSIPRPVLGVRADVLRPGGGSRGEGGALQALARDPREARGARFAARRAAPRGARGGGLGR